MTLGTVFLRASSTKPLTSGKHGAEKDRIESVINKAQRYGYLPSSFENVHSLVDNMESKLFNYRILSNPRHVLYQLQPLEKSEKDTGYNLRQRSHHLTLPFTCDQEEFSAQNVIYGYLLGVCVSLGVCLPPGVCMYIST